MQAPKRSTAPRHTRSALGVLATMLTEYGAPQLRTGLGSLEARNDTLASPQGRITILEELQLEKPIQGHIFAMPDGRIFYMVPSEGHPPWAAFLDTKTGALSSWQFSFRPFSVSVDRRRNWIWAVEGSSSHVRAYDAKGVEKAALPIPSTVGGWPVCSRHTACADNDLFLGFYNGFYSVLRLDASNSGRPPSLLAEDLPHTERLYSSRGLLFSTHFNPNTLMIHSSNSDAHAPLRSIFLRGEPHTLVQLDEGYMLSTKAELLRLGADCRICWSIEFQKLKELDLYLPSLAEADGGSFWLNNHNSNTLFRIRASIHEQEMNA